MSDEESKYTEVDEVLKQYRETLVLAEQKSQESYDKTVLTLSGGALGLSFTFIKEIIGTGEIMWPIFLQLSWAAWIISLTCILMSYYFSFFALRMAIKQVDENLLFKPIGGWYSAATSILNALGGICFLVGIGLMGIFIYNNLG